MVTSLNKNGQVALREPWKSLLKDEFKQDYMHQLSKFLQAETQAGKVIYPNEEKIFSALDSTDFTQLKVVILGQDPYHGPNQAHGLCFSVLPGVKVPPSLKNIYKELQADLGIAPAIHGCLNSWAEQGVLLLNSVLTVEAAKAASHQKKGWERFTDKVISLVNERHESLVFLLWGSYAQKKGQFIDRNKHLVLESAHPSPLSAHRGFLGNKHFSQTNAYLQMHDKKPINWALPAQ